MGNSVFDSKLKPWTVCNHQSGWAAGCVERHGQWPQNMKAHKPSQQVVRLWNRAVKLRTIMIRTSWCPMPYRRSIISKLTHLKIHHLRRHDAKMLKAALFPTQLVGHFSLQAIANHAQVQDLSQAETPSTFACSGWA